MAKYIRHSSQGVIVESSDRKAYFNDGRLVIHNNSGRLNVGQGSIRSKALSRTRLVGR